MFGVLWAIGNVQKTVLRLHLVEPQLRWWSNARQFYYNPILIYFPWNILMAFHMKILVALEVEFILLQNIYVFSENIS